MTMTKYPTTHDVLEESFLAVNKAFFDIVEGLGDPATWVGEAAAEVDASSFSLTLHKAFTDVAGAYTNDLIGRKVKLPSALNKMYDMVFPLFGEHALVEWDLDRNYNEDISVARQVAHLLPITGDVVSGLSILLTLLNTRRHRPDNYEKIKRLSETYKDYQILTTFYSFERRRRFTRVQRINSSTTTGVGYTRLASMVVDAFASKVSGDVVIHSWYNADSRKKKSPLFLVFDIKAQKFALHVTE